MNKKTEPIILLDEIEKSKPKYFVGTVNFEYAFFDFPPIDPKLVFNITTACWCKHPTPTFTRSRFNPKLLKKTKKSL